ncbi:hypothetical protein VMCG_08416 [Cytospora schulzeri]|uniref:Uncharacterized protein n=1 Tax=Cytospora schulzeri TaxID=448051 RepID=A0A423VR18_9PEZI|nr:hypothetical protein VMCG_08416 [Valsa malicola]
MPRLFRSGVPLDDPLAGSVSAILRRQDPNQDNGKPPGDSNDLDTTGSNGNSISSSSPNATAIVRSSSPSLTAPRGDPPSSHKVSQIIAVSIVGVVVLVCIFLLIRTLRARHPNPKSLPSPLRKIWRKWNVTPYPPKTQYKRTGDSDMDDQSNHRIRMREAHDNLEDALRDAMAQQELAAQPNTNNNTGTQDGVNRNTSIRSVMTLPVYRPKATETEQVLGREGERDGIDTVVEMPTAEEDEHMREEEMDALYQIRVARRRQIAEREQRRQERREARERRDYLTMHDVRERARIASEQAQREVEELRDAHEAIKQSRQRAVSSVSYHDVGLVRADGTRLRANSAESERMGLLSDAASIALSAQETGGNNSLQQSHTRAPSSHSVLSIDTFHSGQSGVGGQQPRGSTSRSGSPGLGTGHSRTSSRGQLGESLLPRTGSSLSQRAGSSPELIDAAEADLGGGDDDDDDDVPAHSPPGYENVSLDEVTPAQSSAHHHPGGPQSGRNSPYAEPPPDYPGRARQNRLSAHMADLAADSQQRLSPDGHQGAGGHGRKGSRGVGGIPQLPSLRLGKLPQIVIEPSSAVPRDGDEDDDDGLHRGEGERR